MRRRAPMRSRTVNQLNSLADAVLRGLQQQSLGDLSSADPIGNIANAIAQAEGYFTPGTAPNRFNNPGDLSKGDEWGQTVSGFTQLPDGEILIIFASPQDGWNALFAKLENILSGGSSRYRPDMSWQQIGMVWAGNSRVWARNVAAVLGVDVNSTFEQYTAQSATPVPSSGDLNTILQDGTVVDPAGNIVGAVSPSMIAQQQDIKPVLTVLAVGGAVLGVSWLLDRLSD